MPSSANRLFLLFLLVVASTGLLAACAVQSGEPVDSSLLDSGAVVDAGPTLDGAQLDADPQDAATTRPDADASTPTDGGEDAAAPCTDVCTAGEVRCMDGASQGCVRTGECTTWGDVIACASGACADATMCAPEVALVALDFADDTSYRVGDGANWVGTGDFNGDHHLDVVSVNTDDSTVSLLLGTGDGTLRAATTVPLSHSRGNGALVHAAVGDLEPDGRADLVVSWRNVNQISVFRGASFTSPMLVPASSPEGIAIADLNGDGRGDIVYASRRITGHAIAIAFQNRDGTFADPVRTPVSTPYTILPSDHDGDGDIDLSVVAASIATWTNTGDGTFTETWNSGVSGSHDELAVADFTSDGLPDLLTTFSGTNVKSLRRALPGNRFEDTTTALYVGDSRQIATADFNRDGHADLVLGACCNTIGVALGAGDATFSHHSFRIGCGTVGAYTTGDLDEDGLPDVIVGHGSCDSVSVLLNRSH